MKKHVDVIVHTAHGNGYEIDVAADPGQVLPQSLLNVFCNELCALFGAKYDMLMVLCKGVSHGLSPLSGLDSTPISPTAYAVGYNIPPLPGLASH